MPRRKALDSAAVDDLLTRQERLASHRQLTALGLPLSTTTSRIRPEGPWQRILPGVVLTHRGTPTRREQTLAALLFCGDDAVLTGLTALALRGVRAARGVSDVHVLTPEPRQRSSFAFVVVQRTRRLPKPHAIEGLPVVSVARAVVDASRMMTRKDAVRELVAEVVQRRMCRVDELIDEIRAGARQRSALSRRVLAEIEDGVRSVAEMQAREILQAGGLPAPQWNVALWSSSGEFIAEPDAYWDEVAAAIQIDSMRWHLGPSQYKRTQQRQRDMATLGVLVMPVAPDHIISESTAFLEETRALLAAAGARARPLGVHIGPHPIAA